MPTIRVSGPALARDYGQVDSESGQRGAIVTDPKILATLHGTTYDGEEMLLAAYLGDGGDNTLVDAGVSGGVVRFEYPGSGGFLIAMTEYQAPRLLTEAELLLLKEYTIGQWLDGIDVSTEGALLGRLTPDLLAGNDEWNEQNIKIDQWP